jgi:hypothetical protein
VYERLQVKFSGESLFAVVLVTDVDCCLTSFFHKCVVFYNLYYCISFNCLKNNNTLGCFLNFSYYAILLFQVGMFCLPALVSDFHRIVWPVTSIVYRLYLNHVHIYY